VSRDDAELGRKELTMSRKSRKTAEQLEQERKLRDERAAERDAFRQQVFDKRRYRWFTMEELLALRGVINEGIEARKEEALAELEAKRKALDAQIAALKK